MTPEDQFSMKSNANANRVLWHLHRNPGSTRPQMTGQLSFSYGILGIALRRLRGLGYIEVRPVDRRALVGEQAERYTLTAAGVAALKPEAVEYCSRKPDPRAKFTRQVLLSTLEKHGELSLSDLAVRSGFSRDTPARYVPAMLAEKLVTARRSGRAWLISVSCKGGAA